MGKPITQEEINETYPAMMKDIQDELQRSKKFCNENGYHVATAISPIVQRYRNELKNLQEILKYNIS